MENYNGVFDKKFLHTEFDQSLVGKEVFYGNTEKEIIDRVKWNSHKADLTGKTNNPEKPFKVHNIFDMKYVYYDPNHENKYKDWYSELSMSISSIVK